MLRLVISDFFWATKELDAKETDEAVPVPKMSTELGQHFDFDDWDVVFRVESQDWSSIRKFFFSRKFMNENTIDSKLLKQL